MLTPTQPTPKPTTEPDPALTARTFSQNPTLKNALARIAAQHNTARLEPSPKPISKVEPMSLSATAIKLAHRYMGIVNKYENEFDSCGYTPRELELVRTRAHNELIAQLRDEGIDVSDRAATTELARLVERWLTD